MSGETKLICARSKTALIEVCQHFLQPKWFQLSSIFTGLCCVDLWSSTYEFYWSAPGETVQTGWERQANWNVRSLAPFSHTALQPQLSLFLQSLVKLRAANKRRFQDPLTLWEASNPLRNSWFCPHQPFSSFTAYESLLCCFILNDCFCDNAEILGPRSDLAFAESHWAK